MPGMPSLIGVSFSSPLFYLAASMPPTGMQSSFILLSTNFQKMRMNQNVFKISKFQNFQKMRMNQNVFERYHYLDLWRYLPPRWITFAFCQNFVLSTQTFLAVSTIGVLVSLSWLWLVLMKVTLLLKSNFSRKAPYLSSTKVLLHPIERLLTMFWQFPRILGNQRGVGLMQNPNGEKMRNNGFHFNKRGKAAGGYEEPQNKASSWRGGVGRGQGWVGGGGQGGRGGGGVKGEKEEMRICLRDCMWISAAFFFYLPSGDAGNGALANNKTFPKTFLIYCRRCKCSWWYVPPWKCAKI